MTGRSPAQAAPAVLYCYSPDRKGEHPRAHLASFRGILQADGYAGYAGLYDRGVTEAACWAHARRKFFDVHAATAVAAGAGGPAPDRGAVCDRGDDPRPAAGCSAGRPHGAERAAVHRIEGTGWTTPWARISGKSDLAGAIRYTLTRWDALTLVLARRPRLHRQQRRRTHHAADHARTEKLAVRRFRCRRRTGRRASTH